MAENKKILNTVIVLRHDTKESWEATDAYVLLKGELGIGYTTDGKVIVKAGIYDGKTESTRKTWKELPQVEGVFENDLTLTYAFGKYAPDKSGSFILTTAGKTMSEVMLDAFAQEDFGQDPNKPIITKNPSASFTVVNGSTSGEVGAEHGKPKVKLTLDTTGTYRYGCKDSNNNGDKDTPAAIKVTKAEIQDSNGNVLKEMTSTEMNNSTNSTIYLEYEHALTGNALKYSKDTANYTFYAYANSGDDANRPLTNLGNFINKDDNGNYSGTKVFADAEEYIPAKAHLTAEAITISYRGYRKMFMGISDTDATIANTKLTSAFIRGLTTVSTEAAKTSKEFSVAAGKKYFYVAIPETLTKTAPDVYYKPFSNYETFSTVEYLGTVDVEGANSYTATPYRIYRGYSETGTFESATAIKVTVK